MLRLVVKTVCISAVSFLLIGFKSNVMAQDNPFFVTDKHLSNTNQSSLSSNIQSFQFKNLEGSEYYRDEKKLKLIHRAEKAEDQELLVTLLEEYLSHFTIANFSHNSDLLWKLAQLYEQHGRKELAKYLYRIILKHTDYNIEYIWQYYDNLTIADKDNYVPIDYYYDLVEFRKQIDTLRPPRGVFISMGTEVNSEFEDYGPSLNVSNNKLLFTSKRNRLKNMGQEIINEDIFWSIKNDENSWEPAHSFDGVNSNFNEGSPCLSKDGQTLYFIRCESPDGFGSCDIYTAQLNPDDTWGNVKNLGVNVNSMGWDSHPSLSHTEDTLYFVSDRVGGYGSTDIYYTYKIKSGWARARNMGPVINTMGTDVSPFYHPKHHVLYFSSNGQLLNFGNFDIYRSHVVNGQWTEPKNIGPLVNGGGEEFYFTIDSESKDLFYARSEVNNFKNLDLFSFPLPMGAQPTATTLFQGSLVDSVSGLPFDGIVSIIDLDNGIEVAPKYIRPDGTFSFELIGHNQYLLVIQGEDFFRIEEIFNLKGDTAIQITTQPINLVKIEFESLEFASSSAEILSNMTDDLDKLLDFMLDNPRVKMNISGHTDSQGNPKVNQQLSQDRADAIKRYLVTRGGVGPLRIEATGYGHSVPIVKNEKTEDDRKLNRRVEFEIIKPNDERAWGGIR